jgi:hypothetical protein
MRGKKFCRVGQSRDFSRSGHWAVAGIWHVSRGALGSAPCPVQGESLLFFIAMLYVLTISILAPNSSMPLLASTTTIRSGASASAEHLRFNLSRDEKNDSFRMQYNLEFARHIEISAGNASLRRETRILCLIYTCSTRHDRLEAIAETWGKKCTGFIAVSNQTDAKLGAVSVPHDGPEVYNNMWQKVRSMWKYVHEHFVDEFDFFYVCGDDNFVVNTHPRTRCHITTLLRSAPHATCLRIASFPRADFRESPGVPRVRRAGKGIISRTVCGGDPWRNRSDSCPRRRALEEESRRYGGICNEQSCAAALRDFNVQFFLLPAHSVAC